MSMKTKRILFWSLLITLNLLIWSIDFHKYTVSACDLRYPTAGVSSLMAGYVEAAPYRYITEADEKTDNVGQAQDTKAKKTKKKKSKAKTKAKETEIDLSCWKLYTASEFKKLGIVTYGNYHYTWYSEKILPGGGLDIPGRHNVLIDGLPVVCDKDGYICLACDFFAKGTILNTPLGVKGKCYDTGAGPNIDVYVGW